MDINKELIKKEFLSYVFDLTKDVRDPSSNLSNLCVKKAENLFNYYVDVIINVTKCKLPFDYYLNTAKLFFWAFITDSSLDSKKDNLWMSPTFLFISKKVFSDYILWLNDNFSNDIKVKFWKLYNKQMDYQIIEKFWEMPSAYIVENPDYSKYFRKFILALFPLVMLEHYKFKQEEINNLIEIFMLFYSIGMAYDDIMDINYDIHNKTITPIIGKFFVQHDEMPTNNSNFKYLIQETIEELQILEEKSISKCLQYKVNEKNFKHIVVIKNKVSMYLSKNI